MPGCPCNVMDLRSVTLAVQPQIKTGSLLLVSNSGIKSWKSLTFEHPTDLEMIRHLKNNS